MSQDRLLRSFVLRFVRTRLPNLECSHCRFHRSPDRQHPLDGEGARQPAPKGRAPCPGASLWLLFPISSPSQLKERLEEVQKVQACVARRGRASNPPPQPPSQLQAQMKEQRAAEIKEQELREAAEKARQDRKRQENYWRAVQADVGRDARAPPGLIVFPWIAAHITDNGVGFSQRSGQELTATHPPPPSGGQGTRRS